MLSPVRRMNLQSSVTWDPHNIEINQLKAKEAKKKKKKIYWTSSWKVREKFGNPNGQQKRASFQAKWDFAAEANFCPQGMLHHAVSDLSFAVG